jgi:hypothetical protein
MQMMFTYPLKMAALWLLSFGLMVTIIGIAIDAPHLVLLRREHAETSGEVTHLHPEYHGVVDVKYAVAGVPYEATLFPYFQEGSIARGELVRVYYSPRNPKIASLAPPQQILEEELPSWAAGSLLGSFGITAAVLILWRKLAPIARAVLGRP